MSIWTLWAIHSIFVRNSYWLLYIHHQYMMSTQSIQCTTMLANRASMCELHRSFFHAFVYWQKLHGDQDFTLQYVSVKVSEVACCSHRNPSLLPAFINNNSSPVSIYWSSKLYPHRASFLQDWSIHKPRSLKWEDQECTRQIVGVPAGFVEGLHARVPKAEANVCENYGYSATAHQDRVAQSIFTHLTFRHDASIEILK